MLLLCFVDLKIIENFFLLFKIKDICNRKENTLLKRTKERKKKEGREEEIRRGVGEEMRRGYGME